MLNPLRILCALLIVTAVLFAMPGKSAADYICGADLTGDGDTDDKGELQGCWNTDEGGTLCPITTGGCTATYTPVECPDGGTLNTSTDRCELAGGVNCPSGYAYNSTSAICTQTSSCPASGTLDKSKDVCYRSVQCPSGYWYYSAYNACVKTPTCPYGGSYNGAYDRCTASPTYTCPSGYTYNSYTGKCMGGYACPATGSATWVDYGLVNSDKGYICVDHATMSCPSGYSLVYYWCGGECDGDPRCTRDQKDDCRDGGAYNAATGKCEKTITSTIPEGYLLDPTTEAYFGDPVCPGGTSYNKTTNICEGTLSSYECPSGYTVKTNFTGCEALKCSGGSTFVYSTSGSYCKSSATINCPSGFTFSSGYCTKDPSCEANAVFNSGSDKCVYDALYGCPTGYTYNKTTGRCERDPVCPDGSAYDKTIDRCLSLIPASVSCPLGSYSCSTAGTCTKTYPCDTGFQTMEICTQNCDGTCASYCNSDALSAFGDIFWVGTAEQWFGITGVEGNGDSLVFYGKDASFNNIEVGRIVMNGCLFTGKAEYFTKAGDNCSSTSWGLSGIQASGNTFTFYGGECGVDAGSITIEGCYINAAQSIGDFDLTRILGSGSSLTLYGGSSGNQLITTIGLCQYGWKCSTCAKTAACAYMCPDADYLLTDDHRCVKFADCPENGALSTQLDKCEAVALVECPEGYAAVDSECRKDPTCPVDSTFNGTINKCVTLTGITCPVDGQAYDPKLGYCTASAICPTGGTSDGNNVNTCSASFLTTECPAGATYDKATGKCKASPSGYGVLDTTLDKYVFYATGSTSCESGWTYTDGKCQKDPVCKGDGVWTLLRTGRRTSAYRCEAPASYSCSRSGYTYSSYTYNSWTYWGCTKPISCTSNEDVVGSQCASKTPVKVTCPNKYAYDQTLPYYLACATEAVCETGTLDKNINYCKLEGSALCPSGYTLKSTTSRCEAPPSCTAPGAYSSTLDICTAQAGYDCPAGYTYLSGVCYRLPDCPNGTFNKSTKSCYEGFNTCTLGDYPCYTYKGERLCSPYACVDSANPTVTDTVQSDLTSPEDDGTVDEEGNCEGQFYVLSGTAGECRTSGTQTLFKNCCNTSNAMNPMFCDISNEGAVAQKVAQDMCHYVGTYCSEEWALIGCVQSKKVYCCFNSKLARIINEQGRDQLQSFQPDVWGTPENPVCRGFAPEEFQMLDFSKIDLTEFFEDIKSNIPLSEDVKQGAEQKIYDYYQNVQ